jgi:hypothetical protein
LEAPATVRVPDLEVVPVLASMVTVTVPGLDPELGDTPIHDTEDDAVQLPPWQPAGLDETGAK